GPSEHERRRATGSVIQGPGALGAAHHDSGLRDGNYD
ncbi:5-methyltetrahydrofolate--homocysteine methyltransferase, partial [uncultured Rubrobacteraceae bacterium]